MQERGGTQHVGLGEATKPFETISASMQTRVLVQKVISENIRIVGPENNTNWTDEPLSFQRGEFQL
jgi:hypothetical protein